MTCREAAEVGRSLGFCKYNQTAHSLANRSKETGVMRVPELAAAMYGKGQKQEALVLNYIEAHGGITREQAMTELNIWNLPGAINKLRKKGFQIVTERHPMKKGGTFAVYRL